MGKENIEIHRFMSIMNLHFNASISESLFLCLLLFVLLLTHYYFPVMSWSWKIQHRSNGDTNAGLKIPKSIEATVTAEIWLG